MFPHILQAATKLRCYSSIYLVLSHLYALLTLSTLVCQVASRNVCWHLPFLILKSTSCPFPLPHCITGNYISQVAWAAHFWVKLTNERQCRKTGRWKQEKSKSISPSLFFFVSIANPAFPSCSLIQQVNLLLYDLTLFWRLCLLGSS